MAFRPLRLLLAAIASVLVLGLLPSHATAAPAEEPLPPGFTDGVPVGGDAGPAADPGAPTPTSPDASTSAAGGTKYFGAAPWQAISASVAATSRSCSVSDTGLKAMVVAPVFKESSAASSPSSAPAPMTLSRYDEWTGTYGDTGGRNANYGLYAFRNPNTSYKRAFWHPGIGIWQYDTAGVGAPFTAIERMDVATVSADVAVGMARRYCSPSTYLIGHGAPFTDRERRNSAWAPWGYPCTLCEQEFQAMYGASPKFSNVSLVSGISNTGGAKKRSCTLQGVAGTVTCWYVSPTVGTIEGATGWATLDPSGGSSPTVAPTPLAYPFYVVERNGREERHWLHEDTGYAIDISGTRQLGKNDRPDADQAGSGITWSSSSGLCDLTTTRGACLPIPPSGITSTTLKVNGTYRPIALDANADGRGDVLWYAPGKASDVLWFGGGSGNFLAAKVNIEASYDTVLPLDVDGDRADDILWYSRRTGAGYLWHADGTGRHTAIKLHSSPGLRPLVVDRNGDDRDEIFWYGPGSATDAWAVWNGSGFTATTKAVNGSFLPFVGDFDGNGTQDIFWYAPGPAADHLWLHKVGGGVVDQVVPVNGAFVPLVGDYDGDGADDIFWYAPGSAPDALWWGGHTFAKTSASVSASYVPLVVDLAGDGRDDLIWYAPGAGRDPWWRWSSGRAISGSEITADGQHQAFVGGFSAGGRDGLVWYQPGAGPDAVWWH